MDLIDVFLVSISPLGAGVGVPMGVACGINPVAVIVVSSIGNLLPIFLFYRIIDVIKRCKFISCYLNRAHEKTEGYTTKYGSIGIVLATPTFGGYFTGIGAALVDISLHKTMPALFVGLLLQGIIFTWLTYLGIDVWECFKGYLRI